MSRAEPIYLKKWGKGDMRWSTKKKVMVWILDTEEKFLSLPQNRKDKIAHTLGAIHSPTIRLPHIYTNGIHGIRKCVFAETEKVKEWVNNIMQ